MQKVEAWQYGPVIRDVYDEVKHYGKHPIKNYTIFDVFFEKGEIPELHDFSPEHINKDVKNFLLSVWETYKPYTGLQLSAWSHQSGSPWSSAISVGVNEALDSHEMINYFKSQLKDE